MPQVIREVPRGAVLAVLNRSPHWQIRDEVLPSLAAHVSGPLAFYWDEEADDKPDDPGYEIYGGNVAVLKVSGVLVDSEPDWWFRYGGYASTPLLTRATNAIGTDANITDVEIIFDTPGGQQSGMYGFCEAIYNLRAKKRVWGACIQACSAGYEAAAQCNKIYLAEDGMAGCIGTMIAVSDWSKYYADAGVIMEVIASTGAETYKGMGYHGTKLTDEQKADLKRQCDEFQTLFNGVMIRGRGFEPAAMLALADGRSHVGRKALGLGLIDAIATPNEVLAALSTGAETCGSTDPVPPGCDYTIDPDEDPTDTLTDQEDAGATETLRLRVLQQSKRLRGVI